MHTSHNTVLKLLPRYSNSKETNLFPTAEAQTEDAG